MAKLEDVCDINMGQSPDSITYNDIGEGLPFFQGNADFGEKNPTVRVWCNSPIKIANKGDILISVRAPIGAINIANNTCCIGRGLAAITVNSEICNANYLWYCLGSKIEELKSKGTGSTFKAINKKALGETAINIRSLDEQRHIAAVLDKVSELIALRKRQLDLLDELVRARFVEMFGDLKLNPMGWKKAPLKNYANVIVGYPFASENYTETGIKIVGGYNLMQGFILWENSKYWIDSIGYEQYLLQANDIIMAMDRPWVGNGFKMSKVDTKHLPALLIQRTACIRVFDIKRDFLYEMLNSSWFADHCNIKGSLVPHISNKDINSFEVFVPQIDLQNQFADFVQQVDKSKVTVQQGLDRLELLKSALMQKYFG